MYTAGCQTGCQTRLTTGLTTGWMFVYTMHSNDYGPIKGYSETMQDLLLITNRMNFRLVPKSVTLNDLGWRNGPYFALFHRIRLLLGRTA